MSYAGISRTGTGTLDARAHAAQTLMYWEAHSRANPPSWSYTIGNLEDI